jgi:hypothetical protein
MTTFLQLGVSKQIVWCKDILFESKYDNNIFVGAVMFVVEGVAYSSNV